ncbi:PapB/FocB family fimbrial expression transcriptional regulator [Escherichia coli]
MKREICECHEVSQGYFSGALRRFQIINQTVIKLIPYIQKELHLKTVVQ